MIHDFVKTFRTLLEERNRLAPADVLSRAELISILIDIEQFYPEQDAITPSAESDQAPPTPREPSSRAPKR